MPARSSQNPGEKPQYVYEMPDFEPDTDLSQDPYAYPAQEEQAPRQATQLESVPASRQLVSRSNVAAEASDLDDGYDGEKEYVEPRTHTVRRVGIAVVAATVLVGGAGVTVNWLNNTDKASVERTMDGALGRILGRTHTSPPAEAETVEPSEETPATTQAAPSKPTPSVTAQKPSAAAKVPAAIVPPVEACVDATPVGLKLAQQTMLPLSSKSNVAETMALQNKYPTNWTIRDNVDVATLQKVQNVYPGIRARLATNDEGGTTIWFKNPNGSALPSMADIESGKVTPEALQRALTDNLIFLKKNGIFQNLGGPLVDIAKTAGQEKGRMFTSTAKAEAYMKTYLEVANAVGSIATAKHFPGELGFGNTNTQAVVKTASYAELEKSGLLKPYTALNAKGKKNWAMMSSATTPGWPDAKLDNKKQNVFNPAAYAALDKLTGGAPTMSSALGSDVLSLKNIPVEKAVVESLAAGANMALISTPDVGKTVTQQFEANLTAVEAALKSGELKLDIFDASYLKVLGNKSLTACNVLKAYDAKAYDELTKPQPSSTKLPAATPTGKVTESATGTPTPSQKPSANTADPNKVTVAKTTIIATGTKPQTIRVNSTAVATATSR
jgi:hypothetical protein